MDESLIVPLDDQKLTIYFQDLEDLYNTMFCLAVYIIPSCASVFIHPLFTPSAPTPIPPPPTNTKPIMVSVYFSKLDQWLLVLLCVVFLFFHLVFCYYWEANECKPEYNPELARPFIPRPGHSRNPLIDYLQLQEERIAKREGRPILPHNQGLPAVVKRGVKGEFPWPMPTRHPDDMKSLDWGVYVCLIETPNVASSFSTAYTFTETTHEGDGALMNQLPYTPLRLFLLLFFTSWV